jgi:hypothetical protein
MLQQDSEHIRPRPDIYKLEMHHNHYSKNIVSRKCLIVTKYVMLADLSSMQQQNTRWRYILKEKKEKSPWHQIVCRPQKLC